MPRKVRSLGGRLGGGRYAIFHLRRFRPRLRPRTVRGTTLNRLSLAHFPFGVKARFTVTGSRDSILLFDWFRSLLGVKKSSRFLSGRPNCLTIDHEFSPTRKSLGLAFSLLRPSNRERSLKKASSSSVERSLLSFRTLGRDWNVLSTLSGETSLFANDECVLRDFIVCGVPSRSELESGAERIPPPPPTVLSITNPAAAVPLPAAATPPPKPATLVAIAHFRQNASLLLT